MKAFISHRIVTHILNYCFISELGFFERFLLCNPTILTQPPTVDPIEKILPRVHRTALFQLRSGFCKALNSYQNRFDLSIKPACPECDSGEPHTTNHLFHCLSHSTELDVRDARTSEVNFFFNHFFSFSIVLFFQPIPILNAILISFYS